MVKPAHRDQLLALAEMWEQLARDREKLTRRHPEPFIQGESHLKDRSLAAELGQQVHLPLHLARRGKT